MKTETIFAALFIVIAIVFMPFAFIWGFNTLIPSLAIPYTFKTWLAISAVGVFFRGLNFK